MRVHPASPGGQSQVQAKERKCPRKCNQGGKQRKPPVTGVSSQESRDLTGVCGMFSALGTAQRMFLIERQHEASGENEQPRENTHFKDQNDNKKTQVFMGAKRKF